MKLRVSNQVVSKQTISKNSNYTDYNSQFSLSGSLYVVAQPLLFISRTLTVHTAANFYPVITSLLFKHSPTLNSCKQPLLVWKLRVVSGAERLSNTQRLIRKITSELLCCCFYLCVQDVAQTFLLILSPFWSSEPLNLTVMSISYMHCDMYS